MSQMKKRLISKIYPKMMSLPLISLRRKAPFSPMLKKPRKRMKKLQRLLQFLKKTQLLTMILNKINKKIKRE